MAAVRPLVVKAGRVRMLPASDSLDWSWLSGIPAPLALWAGINPAEKANTLHAHVIGDVTGLQAALDGKQPAGSYALAAHAHTMANVSGLDTALANKADASHTHSQSDVTNLVGDLAAKASRESPTFGGGYMRIGTYGPTHTVSGGHFESYFSENMPSAGANWRLMARGGAGGLVPLRLDVSGEVVSGDGFVTQGNSYQIRSGSTIQGRMQHNGTNLYVSSDVGDLYLRPAGLGTATNQLWLQAGAATGDPAIIGSGNIHVGKGNSFVSVGATADHVGGGIANFNSAGNQCQLGVFAGNGSGNAGMIYIRPDGRSSAVGQSTFSTTAAIIGTDMTVSGKQFRLTNAGSEFYRAHANSASLGRQPRIFIQSADPGAAAAAGDLWGW